MPITKYKAAAVTSEPAWFDLEAGVQKTINFINEAGQAGCKLVAFPEVCKSSTTTTIASSSSQQTHLSQGFPDTRTGCGR
ncbi:cyanide hydratase [Colletotrichum sojae]|uniref:Cyanide hydratase n=1 Tax=Colletotrichum sojae TaxID=2175907 RepID=A0A8H6MLA3_9PEZI|nr:cyanide hydratase [Colletotrichum sojae]